MPNAPAEFVKVDHQVRHFIESKGFFELPHKWLNKKLPVATLELSAPNAATLGKCLFDDTY